MQKTVFITGGSTGIGAACVRKFNQEGWNTAFMDINAEDGQKLAKELDVLFIKGSTTNPADLENAVNETYKKYGD